MLRANKLHGRFSLQISLHVAPLHPLYQSFEMLSDFVGPIKGNENICELQHNMTHPNHNMVGLERIPPYNSIDLLRYLNPKFGKTNPYCKCTERNFCSIIFHISIHVYTESIFCHHSHRCILSTK